MGTAVGREWNESSWSLLNREVYGRKKTMFGRDNLKLTVKISGHVIMVPCEDRNKCHGYKLRTGEENEPSNLKNCFYFSSVRTALDLRS